MKPPQIYIKSYGVKTTFTEADWMFNPEKIKQALLNPQTKEEVA